MFTRSDLKTIIKKKKYNLSISTSLLCYLWYNMFSQDKSRIQSTEVKLIALVQHMSEGRSGSSIAVFIGVAAWHIVWAVVGRAIQLSVIAWCSLLTPCETPWSKLWYNCSFETHSQDVSSPSRCPFALKPLPLSAAWPLRTNRDVLEANALVCGASKLTSFA